MSTFVQHHIKLQTRDKGQSSGAGRGRARLAFDAYFKKYTWATGEALPACPEERWELQGQIRALMDSAKKLKRAGDPRKAESARLLQVMRDKLKLVAERDGRYANKRKALDVAGSTLQARCNGPGRGGFRVAKVGQKHGEECDEAPAVDRPGRRQL